MNMEMIIHQGDKMEVVVRRADDGTNDGSIIVMRRPGHAYCLAKAPRYASDEEWEHNAALIVDAIRTANPSHHAEPRSGGDSVDGAVGGKIQEH